MPINASVEVCDVGLLRTRRSGTWQAPSLDRQVLPPFLATWRGLDGTVVPQDIKWFLRDQSYLQITLGPQEHRCSGTSDFDLRTILQLFALTVLVLRTCRLEHRDRYAASWMQKKVGD
jgi:hypothetical protein